MNTATFYLLTFGGGGLFFGTLVHSCIRDGRAWGVIGPNDRSGHPIRFWLGVGAHVLMTGLCTFGFVWSVTDGFA